MSQCIWDVQHFHTNRSDTGLQTTNHLQKLQKPESKPPHLAPAVGRVDNAIQWIAKNVL